LFLEFLYEALKEYSERRIESFDRLEYTNEIARLKEKVITLESKIDRLVDFETTYLNRIDYWRGMYLRECQKLRKLRKVHLLCPKKSIILYR
jgi:hypothetical protein